MVKVGVTGTRSGMNKRQKQEFTELLTKLGTGEFTKNN
jgi:hypothetical protein